MMFLTNWVLIINVWIYLPVVFDEQGKGAKLYNFVYGLNLLKWGKSDLCCWFLYLLFTLPNATRWILFRLKWPKWCSFLDGCWVEPTPSNLPVVFENNSTCQPFNFVWYKNKVHVSRKSLSLSLSFSLSLMLVRTEKRFLEKQWLAAYLIVVGKLVLRIFPSKQTTVFYMRL